MIQLYVNRNEIELSDSINLSFSKTNILFAFDDIKCERTTSFTIPYTSNNERIFGLASDIATTGTSMRRRFTADMIVDAVAKRGYLYVDSCDSKGYKAVFVTGELLGLQTIKNAGKIADIIPTSQLTETAAYGSPLSTVYAFNSHDLIYASVVYDIPTTALSKPSIALRLLLQRAATALGVSIATPPSASANIRLLQTEINGFPRVENVQIKRTIVGNYTYMSPSLVSVTSISAMTDMFSQNSLYNAYLDSQNRTYAGEHKALRAKQTTEITFAQDTPADCYIGYYVTLGLYPTYFSAVQFLGDYSFKEDGTTVGTPLAGRTISVPPGQDWMLLRKGDWVSGQGWKNTTAMTVNCSIVGTPTKEEGTLVSDSIRLIDNIPDITVTELLKIFAYTSGALLNYTDADGVTFDTSNPNAWPILDINDRLISVDEVTRKFSDYARKNVIEFDSGDNVFESQRLRRIYVIDNDNIEDEKILATIPYSEGEINNRNNINEPIDSEYDVLCLAGNNVSLERATLPSNSLIKSLCDNSTSVEVKVKMSLIEFERLSAKTRIAYRNHYWVWTSAKWSKNVVNLSISEL